MCAVLQLQLPMVTLRRKVLQLLYLLCVLPQVRQRAVLASHIHALQQHTLVVSTFVMFTLAGGPTGAGGAAGLGGAAGAWGC